MTGEVDEAGRLSFPMPVALPPEGSYSVSAPTADLTLEISSSGVRLRGHAATGPARVAFGSAALP